MFESLENRQLMSATLPTAGITDGTSNTIMVGEVNTTTTLARKAGKGQQEYIIVKLSDILITSVQPSGSSEHPMESVSMQFSKVDLEYKPQKPDGTLDAGVHFIYDIKGNKEG